MIDKLEARIDAMVDSAIKKAYMDGYRKGFRDGYNESYAEQLELPKPKLTGKFSLVGGKFKCTGCTGVWDSREDAKHHLCKDYQQGETK